MSTPERQQRPHQLLGVVGDHAHPLRARAHGQGAEDRGILEQRGPAPGIGADVDDRAPAPLRPVSAARVRPTRGERPGSPDQRANRATLPVDPVAAANTAATAATVSSTVRGTTTSGEVEPRGRFPGVTDGGAGGGPDPVGDRRSPAARPSDRRSLGRRPEGALVHQRGEPGPHRAELELGEGLAGLSRVPAAEGQLVDVHVEGHVADQRDHLGVRPDLSGVVGQVLAQLGRQSVEVGEEGVEVPVLVDQLGRRLLPHPGHAGKVVRGIAAQRGQQRVLARAHPGALLDARLVVEGVVADPPPVVEHPDVGILDQLVGVAVAGHDDDRVPPVPGLGGQGGQHVVGLEALGVDHRDGQRAEQGPDHVELGREIGRGLGPAALVVLDDLVAEGPPGKVEGHRQADRTVVPDQVHHHGGEPVDGVGHHAGRWWPGREAGRSRPGRPATSRPAGSAVLRRDRRLGPSA